MHLYDCLDRILQISPVENKYQTLFYIKGYRRLLLIVNCAEFAVMKLFNFVQINDYHQIELFVLDSYTVSFKLDATY